jgi:HK97 family phage major capsid protein
MNKEYFLKRKKALEEKRAALMKRAQESEDVKEVRAINDELLDIANELHDVADILADMAKKEDNGDEGNRRPNGNDDDVDVDVDVDEDDRRRSAFNPNAALNVVATAKMNNGKVERNDDPLATMEYRKAFMNYVQRGEQSPILKFEKRQDAAGVAADLGVLLPTTVVQEIIGGVEKVYGQLYSRVRKTNIKGGVKYPIGSFSATFRRITETTVSDRQNPGSVTGYVEFSYNIGEIRIARTLLQNVLSVPAFEREVAKVIVEAYVKAMDTEIMTGVAANNEMEGILTEANKQTGSRIPASNIITFSPTEMADWKTWRKKLFAAIPLSMRKLKPEFAMTSNTYESNIKTLVDDNNRPVYSETYNPIDGAETARFYGREVVFVEDDILKSFDDATAGEYFGMYWIPEQAYAINSNMEFTMIKYFDQETNQYVDKALVINDGKILDPKYLYLLKKGADTTQDVNEG